MSRRRTVWLIFFACLFIYNANLRYTGSFDSLSSSRLPFRILTGHGLTLEDPGPIEGLTRYSYVLSRHGKWVSLYPVLTPIAVTPLYVAAVWIESSRPWLNRRGVEIAMEKLSASLITALSAVFMLLTLRRLASETIAVWLTVAYAFGTSTWAISSQSLWPHGMEELLLALALFLLARGIDSPRDISLLGIVAGLLAANRPTDVLFSIALAVIVLRKHGKRSWAFFAAAAPIAASVAAYNLAQFGRWTGGYGQYAFPNHRPFGLEPLNVSGLLGLLFSNRGIFVFSPFLLFFFFRRWREGERLPGLRLLLLAYLGSLFLYGLSFDWMGGYCYGPRYAIHGLPVLVMAIAEPLERLWRLAAARAIFVATVVFSVALQVIGAFFYPMGDSGNWRYGLWTFRKSSPALALQAGPAVPNFLLFVPHPGTHGGLDPSDAVCRLGWVASPPPTLRVAENVKIHFRISNLGTSRWSSVGDFFSSRAMRVHWVWSNDREPRLSELSGWLAWRLDPEQTLERTLTVTAPPSPGRANLEIQLFQEGVGPLPFSTCHPLDATVRIVESR